MEYQEKSTLSFPDDTMLPEVYTDTIVCIYNVDGKCNGMLTPERLNILRKAFHRAKCSGLHDHVPLASTMTPNSPITGVSTQGTKCLGQTPVPSPPVFLDSPSAIPFTKKTPCS